MKEKIYTIPINEALDSDDFCPFCHMHRQLEDDAVRYTVGPAMMEPDFRAVTNENGFCQKHMRALHAESKALPLALVMDSHLSRVEDLLSFNTVPDKKSLFKKFKTPKESFVSALAKLSESCAVCSRIEHTFSRYIYSFIYMLKKESGFLEKVLASDGFCMEHFSALSSAAAKELSDSEFEKYFVPIISLQKERAAKYHAYIKNFANSFDYRNAGQKIDSPKDILLKTGHLLNGTFLPKSKKLDDI